MPSDTIVSPTPPGAGRHTDLIADHSTGGADDFSSRGGVNVPQGVTKSNLGQAGGLDQYYGDYNAVGSPVAIMRGGIQYGPGLKLVQRRPAAKFKWPQGLYAYGIVMGFLRNDAAGAADYLHPENAAVDIFAGWRFGYPAYKNTLLDPAGRGFGVTNRAGVWWFASRGIAGLELVSLAPYTAADISTLQKFEARIRHATRDANASLELWVNDVRALVRSFPATAAEAAVSTMYWQPDVAGAALSPELHLAYGPAAVAPGSQVLQYRDRFFYAGPDVPNL